MTRDTSLDIWRESREDNGVVVGLLSLLLEVNCCCPIGEIISEEMIAQEVILCIDWQVVVSIIK